MKNPILLFLAIIIFSSLLGPLSKLPLNLDPVNVYLSDIFVAVLPVYLILNWKKVSSLIIHDKPIKLLVIFIIFAFFTLFISPIRLAWPERFVSLLYLLRFTAYAGIYPAVILETYKNKKNKDKLMLYLNLSGIVLIATGWLQYFLYPDLRNLYYLGWDPHFKRIFALILDPNYLGLLLVFYFLLIHIKGKNQNRNLILKTLTLITLAFTYSRGSFLALLSSGIYYAYRIKKLFLYTGVGLILLFSLVLLPRPGGVGVRLERLFSVVERVENWQYAAGITVKNPFFGIGFNTLRYAGKIYKNLPADWLTSHSAAGIDNSFLFVASTTGLIGLCLFLYFLVSLFSASGILGKSIIIATVVHSLFINSFFFIFVNIWFFTILAIDRKFDVKQNS